MRRLHWVFVRAVVVVATVVVSATAARAQAAPDSVSPQIRRAQRLVNDGNGAEGRAVLDSILNATEPQSPEEAEALFWRATLAESWEQAQKDYLRLMLEHERSVYAGRAMLRLAQGELARGDRDAALRYLERLATETPESPVRGEAGLWHGRLLLDRGAREEGCLVLRVTRPRVPPGALELENQYDYLLRGCPARVVSAPPAADTAQPAAPTTPTPLPASPPAPTPPPADAAMVWSVQAAAFSTAAEATEFAAILRTRGYDARVDGTTAPFRVRFGRYPTRAAASAAMQAYQTKERADAFLTQVPRG